MSYEDRDPYGMYKSNNKPHAHINSLNSGPGPQLMGADTLIGNDVVSLSDDDLGDIKELMLDMKTGHVAYAVLAFGGFLGMGEKLFAVPFSALRLDTLHKRFVLNVERERLQGAPGFDKSQWPDMADAEWARGVHAYYGSKPYADSMNR